jgi:hypothetical protein
MSTQSLPAASLRTGNRLPAGRVFLWVFKHLICWALSSICWSICGAQSIFLPALREAPGSGRRGRCAVRSARVVGVLALAQHHADRGAGQVKGLTQRVDKIAAIGIGKVSGRVLTWVMYCKRNRRPADERRRAGSGKSSVSAALHLAVHARGTKEWLRCRAAGQSAHRTPIEKPRRLSRPRRAA